MKKPSSFAAWQEANQVRREAIIEDYLQYLGKTRVRVRNPTDLADLVARHIAQVEDGPCNKSTLMRNFRYKAKILTYQAEHSESGSRSLRPRGVTDPSTNALVTIAKLEAGNLKREVGRLNIYINSLEEQLEQYQQQGRQRLSELVAHKAESGAHRISDYEFKFVRTCQALRALVSHMNLVLEVDTKAQRILDRSKRRNNVIVDNEIAGPFIEWLASVSEEVK
ncbi:hypothetical protein [Cupriavidus metallidurans]|uniref:Uncharacterized protein n=1 Tax=Cupriavidus metallidurans (strain ATCC 43123 / DSM 2839 / NBRC 102507 / CH34) TaxID=266264 RepID=Q1LLC7_CUPMC|nr:hypothetical protein [Cupriavidus metallidurans]ABF09049.1 hypothetical protein Rmet_2170 [Cupriavidus metallidurans CH34]QGS30062.1 hypothetical protein FOB83_14830 [Cupriavidus metallidurans]